MRRKLSSFVMAATLAFMAVFAFAGSAAAFTSSCEDSIGSGTLRFMAFEGPNYNDGSSFPSGPDHSVLCVYSSSTTSISISDLKNVHYTVPGGNTSCAGQLAPSYGTWNDCISSYQFVSDCHHTLTLYQDANYASVMASYSSSASVPTLGFGYDESISSFKLTYHSICQS